MSQKLSPIEPSAADTQSLPQPLTVSSHQPLAGSFAHGSLIDGTYRILGDVGQGAMGVVLLARD